MIRLTCLVTILVAATVAGTASATTAAPAPTNLRGFVLRADEQEPAATVFHRTPSFAWSPVAGAIGYQFQLSTSDTFRDNAIFFNTPDLTSPVVAPALSLPWINGTPHSLYARVRATVATSSGTEVTPWSDDYGFDMSPPPPPTPMASDPGLLRWTPIEGADSYQIWFVDVRGSSWLTGKKETVRTNVLDEREFYTFHPSPKWMGSVRWRIRAVRSTSAGTPANSFPASTYGQWSPTYNSTNPPATSGMLIEPLHTISDVTSDGSPGSPAHKLMPAFSWKGNLSIDGTAAELYRVEIFSDSACLNLVYTGSVVGSQAYAPRLQGSLSLPSDPPGIAAARGAYLSDGPQPAAETYDGTPLIPQEQLGPAAPTTVAPADAGPPGSAAPAAPGGAPASGGASVPSGAPAPPLAAPALIGAPIDLWDTYWPASGYYWIVMPVGASAADAGASTVAGPGASKGSTLVPAVDTTQFSIGQVITLGVGVNTDTGTITAIGNGLITLSAPLNNGHATGEPIVAPGSSSVVYRDLNLPQEVCAYSNPAHLTVRQFGIMSEPTLTAGQDPFVTGLSADGHLTSAAPTSAFYGQPLVAWTPALGAEAYQVQWGRQVPGATSPYPFKPDGTIMTSSTSAVLPVTAGTWWYRVRGFDYNLPTGAQQMGWTDSQQLVVVAPTFSVAPVVKTKFKVVGAGSTAAKPKAPAVPGKNLQSAVTILRKAAPAFASYAADNNPGSSYDPNPTGTGYEGMTVAYLTKTYDRGLDQRIKIVSATSTGFCAQVTVATATAKYAGGAQAVSGHC